MKLTSTDYIQAERNGIKKTTLIERIKRGWDKNEAKTRPINRKTERARWLRVALEKGMSESTFDYRVYYKGLTYEQAAKEPLRKYKRAK